MGIKEPAGFLPGQAVIGVGEVEGEKTDLQ